MLQLGHMLHYGWVRFDAPVAATGCGRVRGCVMPTRNARTGTLFTTEGMVNIKNARFKEDFSVLDEALDVHHSQTFSKAYLRHLTKANEPLYMEIASVQNLALYLRGLAGFRAAVACRLLRPACLLRGAAPAPPRSGSWPG